MSNENEPTRVLFERLTRGGTMRKYLFHGRYTPEGYKGLLEEGGCARVDAA